MKELVCLLIGEEELLFFEIQGLCVILLCAFA